MLWVAFHLPRLSIESFAATLGGPSGDSPFDRPIALVDAHRITAVDATARAAGVKPGLKRATALALAPRIVLGQADASRDAAALLPLAHAALAYTPSVSMQPAFAPDAAPDTVLLEVAASLRCFGGLDRLLQRLHESLRPFGHELRVAVAATPVGAAILARGERSHRCLDLESTRKALAAAPVWLFGPAREHWEALQGMGLRRLDDLLGLPRSGLARRFGEPLLATIDAALGRRPDPRSAVVPAPAFASRLELFARADSSEQLLHGASVLLERLVAWLAARHAFVRRFRLSMHHERHRRAAHAGDAPVPEATTLEIALAEATRDRAHLLVLLRERLAQLQLPAPSLELSLAAEDIVVRAAPEGDLFPTRQSESEGLTRLVERLQARLGAGRVCRLVEVDDHRPERASDLRAVVAGMRPASGGRPRLAKRGPSGASHRLSRPVWLVPTPEPLGETDGRPVLERRPLKLLSGPERIEAGWWDAALAERDYFIAEANDGALVWIFRERLPLAKGSGGEPAAGWFLHGRFG